MGEQTKRVIQSIYRKDNAFALDELDEKEYAEPDANGKYSLRKALKYHAKALDDLRCDYYLGKAHWNVRKALKLFQADSSWEKQQRVMKELDIDQKQAMSLLEQHKGDVEGVIAHAKKHGFGRTQNTHSEIVAA